MARSARIHLEFSIIRECGDRALPRLGEAQPRYHINSVGRDPMGNVIVRHLSVNLQNSRH
jgi:hypothetical protein